MTVYTQFPQRLYLSGAVFELFIYRGSTAPALVEITPAMIYPAGQWQRLQTETSTGDPLDPMVFTMRPGRHYQLVEVLPPPGYQAPFGQWRIQVGLPPQPPVAGQPTTYWLNWTAIGTVPALYRPALNATVYYVGNQLEFELPLTGGTGSEPMMFTIVGVFVIGAGVTMLLIIAKKRKMTVV